MNAKKYLETLGSRGRESKAYQKHQHIGVEIAEMLGDAKHTGLYIKLCSQYQPEDLLAVAKDIAGKGTVKNKGAYFMKVYKEKAQKI